jgi:hypothetical protein
MDLPQPNISDAKAKALKCRLAPNYKLNRAAQADVKVFCFAAYTAASAWRGRCQGRRTLAFILTLDTGSASSRIGLGTKVRVLS